MSHKGNYTAEEAAKIIMEDIPINGNTSLDSSDRIQGE